jgi:hypothetical protein
MSSVNFLIHEPPLHLHAKLEIAFNWWLFMIFCERMF